MSTKYNSIPKNKSGARGKGKQVSQLAQDSFEAFQPFINLFDCGLKGYNGPFHLITKEDWRIYARHKAGERGLRYEDGEEFNPYRDVIRGIFSPKHVHEHIEEQETTYFTSGRKGLAMFYLDVDAHHPWQTDEYRAKAVLEKVFPSGYFRASNRGQNGYLKIRYQSIREFNEVADHLQKALKRLFLHLGILCDIEVKGTITHNGKSGSLAKLPFQTKCGCHMRDETDSWNYPQLEKFKACPVVKAHQVEYIVRRLENVIDEKKVRRFGEYKKSLVQKEKRSKGEKLKNRSQAARPAQPTRPPVAPTPLAAPAPPKPVRLVIPPIASPAADAFQRNHEDVRPFVRAFWREHRRFPTTQETLDWIKASNRFSGEWEDREGKRAKRVGQILAFTEQGFDPRKLSQGKHKPVVLKVGTYSWWVRQQFGSALTGRIANLRAFDPVAMTAPAVKVSVPAQFVETFLAVTEFCLVSYSRCTTGKVSHSQRGHTWSVRPAAMAGVCGSHWPSGPC